ncbi:M15 family metallopeptidase [Sphaerisporangium flaviroseum]|uniref:D-alanyl-D-alanine dipeptidase n=2 Tax=Sphaerisporangium flaviroseum TaxID=509199 RepID=A0ABP7J8I0_9ACTN
MVLLSDSRIVATPSIECGEPLVDLREISALRVDGRYAAPQGDYAHLRAGVVDRLVLAQTLLPSEYKFLVIEGYRPMALQTHIFEQCVERMRLQSPDAEEAELRRLASRFVSPPEVAPHVAGAAVDLTLSTVDGVELWMGSKVNDTDTPACFTAAHDIGADARLRRDLMGQALNGAGLVNYPTEWWHWSYGDRYWAYSTGAAAARYGPFIHQ